MALEYTKPTWTNDSGAAINAERLQAISDVVDGLVNTDDHAVTGITFDKSGGTMSMTYANGNVKSIENAMQGEKGEKGEKGEQGLPGGLVAAGDGIDYDATTGEVSLSTATKATLDAVDYAYEKGFASKNLFNLVGVPVITRNGITFTPTTNDDGIFAIKASGTYSTEATYVLYNSGFAYTIPKSGIYYFGGGYNSNAHVYPWNYTLSSRPYKDSTKTEKQMANQYGDEVPFYAEKGDVISLCLRLRGESGLTDDTVFYPIISEEWCDCKTPYAKSNVTLTTEVADNTEKIETNASDILVNATRIYNATRRTRKNITTELANLSTAIAEQDLAKYGYAVGDYFVGASGYYYHIADEDTFYAGYSNNTMLDVHHIGIVVDTLQNTAWLAEGSLHDYLASDLHKYLSGDVLTNIQADLTALFGGWSEHLLSHKILNNYVNNWAWSSEAQYIMALGEQQVNSSVLCGTSRFQQGESNKQIELFRKYRCNEIFGSTEFWLRTFISTTEPLAITATGYISPGTATKSIRGVGLILFK